MANFPTLSSPPAFGQSQENEDSVLKSDFEGGYVHTRPRFTRLRKKFSGVVYHVMTDTDKSTLDTFESVTVRGGADSFVWTDPKSTTSYTVRFTKSIKYTPTEFGWDFEFDLEEV
jgi:phage-related protein